MYVVMACYKTGESQAVAVCSTALDANILASRLYVQYVESIEDPCELALQPFTVEEAPLVTQGAALETSTSKILELIFSTQYRAGGPMREERL